MADDQIICAVCGAKNKKEATRCASCGATLDKFDAALSEEEIYARRNQQDTFEWKWVFVSFAVYMVLQGIFLVALPFVIDAYDPQGLNGMMVSALLWFVGGAVVGFISPGKTFFEPAVGALLAVVPTVMWIGYRSDVYELSMMTYMVSAVLGVMITLFGAFLGERLQRG